MPDTGICKFWSRSRRPGARNPSALYPRRYNDPAAARPPTPRRRSSGSEALHGPGQTWGDNAGRGARQSQGHPRRRSTGMAESRAKLTKRAVDAPSSRSSTAATGASFDNLEEAQAEARSYRATEIGWRLTERHYRGECAGWQGREARRRLVEPGPPCQPKRNGRQVALPQRKRLTLG